MNKHAWPRYGTGTLYESETTTRGIAPAWKHDPSTARSIRNDARTYCIDAPESMPAGCTGIYHRGHTTRDSNHG